MHSRKSSAELCRLNGWGKGTLIIGTSYGLTEVIELTAVGSHSVLAKSARAATDSMWNLLDRCWCAFEMERNQ
jgi:hypothetical protein